MPLAIVLDVSLSLSRPVNTESDEDLRKHLAINGINVLLDHLNTNSKLEFASLIVFSSLYEVLSPFTRDYDSIRSKLAVVEDRDKTCLEAAFHGVSVLINEEWGHSAPCHIILITDGSASLNILSLAQRLLNSNYVGVSRSEEGLPLPFNFQAKLHIAVIASPDESCLSISLPVYQKLIELSGAEGQVLLPEGPLSLKSVQSLFMKIAESNFTSFQGTLHAGSLVDSIMLFPPPQNYHHVGDMDVVSCKISKEISICGFLDLVDVGSPPSVSRHLVLPIPPVKGEQTVTDLKTELDMEEENNPADEGKHPSFSVLLHGALKVENMGALCKVGDNWFGLLYSWADSKKKSNLMLSIFEPGNKSIPWLGDLNMIGPLNECQNPSDITSFPIKPSEKRSYAQSCVVWVQQGGLQADIQKILRHARKMPDKTQHFYKELNRLRRAALSLGFLELLDTVAVILERECTLLPHNAHPDCALQLTHAATVLRNVQSRDLRHNITPLRTKFTHDD